MGNTLLTIDITPQIIYLSLLLVIIGTYLKNIPFIHRRMIIWILMIISFIVEFIFIGINFKGFITAIVIASFSTWIYQIYKQLKRIKIKRSD